MQLSSSHWSTLSSAIRSGAVCRLSFYGVNLSALDHEAFLVAIGCRGLQSLSVESSVVPRGFVADDLIRTRTAKDLLQLSYADNKGDAPHRCSDDDVLDFYFPTDAAPEVQSRHLNLEGFKVTDMFLTKCFEVSIFRFDFRKLKSHFFSTRAATFSVCVRVQLDPREA